MKKLVLALLLLSPPCHARDWTDSEVNKEVAWQVLNFIDWGQTRDMSDKCNRGEGTWHENNSLLGHCPSEGRVDNWFLISALGHVVITDYFDKYRGWWQNTTIVVTGAHVANNFKIGLKLNYRW